MPIILAEAHELLDDVMGLVSVHAQTALVAVCDERTDRLNFWFVSVPHPALQNVPVEPKGQIMSKFIARGTPSGVRTFRVKYWAHSAITFEIPAYIPSEKEHQTSYNTCHSTLDNPETEYSLDETKPQA